MISMKDAVPYVVIHKDLHGTIAEEFWHGSLAEAKAYAKKAVLVGTAEEVDVRDSAGRLVFHHPKVLHRA